MLLALLDGNIQLFEATASGIRIQRLSAYRSAVGCLNVITVCQPVIRSKRVRAKLNLSYSRKLVYARLLTRSRSIKGRRAPI